MSTWSQIAGCVWIDSSREGVDLDRQIEWLKKYLEGTENKLPQGSEGSLQYSIQKLDNNYGFSQIMINFYGSLRDFHTGDCYSVLEWLNTKISEESMAMKPNSSMFIRAGAMSLTTDWTDLISISYVECKEKWEIVYDTNAREC